MKPSSLRARLDYEPQALKFGTSGRRAEVLHLTQLEVYLNALAEVQYLQSLPRAEGGIARGDDFYFAYDLRPSSTRYVPEQGGRGEIAQAVVRALHDAGMRPVNLGQIPTPALTSLALARGKGSIMITGSHIPFDRNGYKTNTAIGELLKKHEDPISSRVETVRQNLDDQPFAESPFNSQGLFKTGHQDQDLPPESTAGRDAYIRRYLEFFAESSLKGLRLLAYQHSAVGRDLLVQILEALGAEVVPAGRSETFVPIDTENIDAAQSDTIQALVNEAWTRHGPLDAVVSTDGDSDRPLILGITPASDPTVPGRIEFYGGDLVGMIVAEHLGADAVVVPISCNDAIDHGALKDQVEPKTRIGSPFVIAGMLKARLKGKQVICGWEANGGFLTGSDIHRDGRTLKALPTRDAMLPIVAVLAAAGGRCLSLPTLFAQLPRRFSRAALLRNFPRPVGLRILERFSPANPAINEIHFDAAQPVLLDADGRELGRGDLTPDSPDHIRTELERFVPSAQGFDGIMRLNYTDGLRIYFHNGDVAHVRPSGNADELRIYAVADTQTRADAIAALGIAEPDGLLRRLERAITSAE